MLENPLLVILGPTASGKTKLAAKLALELDGEVISADSRQVFKGMDIGTGKDLDEYSINGRQVPYHLIDHKKAGERYQVNAFKEDFYRVFSEIKQKKKMPVLCGGTGMYIHSILQNHELTAVPVNLQLRELLSGKELEELRAMLLSYPAENRKNADFSTIKRLIRAIEIADYMENHTILPVARPLITPVVVGLTCDTDVRRSKIKARLDQRLKNGLIEEVQGLIHSGVSQEMLVFYGLEYKFIVSFLAGELRFDELKERLFTAICQYAKRQMTFFRKMEKDGVKINWFDVSLMEVSEKDVVQLFKSRLK